MWVSTSTRKWIARAVVVVLPVLALTLLPTQAADCQFILGFATLKALIDEAEGPDKVGECLEDQRFNPVNGDALQQTTGGLMVWRKLDNWTAFTDGYRTWINGPHGLQARLNTETFDWEASPPPTPTPAPTPIPDYGAWEFHDYTDLLTGVTQKQAVLDATDVQGGSGTLPDLTMRCHVGDVENFDVYVTWYTHVGQNNDVPNNRHAVSFRFDDSFVVEKPAALAAREQDATFLVVNDDRENFFYPGLFFLDHTSVAIQVLLYNNSRITTVWDITGAFSTYERIRAECASSP